MPLAHVNDINLHYESSGTGEPVLLIHGMGSSGADWAFQTPGLSTHFRTICPDLRGAGLSDKPTTPYSIELFADDLWRLLDHLGESRCRLVGFSLGGAVALEMALQRPKAVPQLVMINSLPSYRIDHWRKWLEAHMQLTLVRVLGLPRAARVIARRLFPEDYQSPMRMRLEQVVGQNPRQPYINMLRALMKWCAADRLSQLRGDTMMLCGEHDYTPNAETRSWAKGMDAQYFVIKGSRHGTPFDAISATNAALSAFLNERQMPVEQLFADTREQFMTNTAGKR